MSAAETIEPAGRAPSLEAVGMTKIFGPLRALDDVSIKVDAGSFHALLGENGAGKSTLVKCIMGFYSPDAGTVKLDFTEATIVHPVTEIEVDSWAGTTKLVLPPGATVDVEGIELMAGSVRVRNVPQSPYAGTSLHFVVRGRDRAGTVVVRYQRRFWRWTW